MYQALYRQYRPLRFDDVAGQEHITRVLRNQIIRGLSGHAYLFTGTRGTGKTTCARILARAVNCEHPQDGNPCNECEACRSILNESALDVTEQDAASNNSVDDIRTLLSEAAFPPVALKKRVYIIDEVHMLSKSAFNALLKTLEEPPEHVLFILATTELNKVPATILSRCQRFDFRRVDADVIAQNLRRISDAAGIGITDGALALIARMGDGSVRDAQSLLERCRSLGGQLDEAAVTQALGLSGTQSALELIRALARGDAGEALHMLDDRAREGRDMRALLDELTAGLRDLLIWQCTQDAGLLRTDSPQEALEELAGMMSAARTASMIGTVQEAQNRMQPAASGRTDAELALIRAASSANTPQSAGAMSASAAAVPDALLQRLAALENAVRNLPAGGKAGAKASGEEKAVPQKAEAPKKQEKPADAAPGQPGTQDLLPQELKTRLSAAVIDALGPIKASFFDTMPLYWDGKTLSAVHEGMSKAMLTYDLLPAIETAVRTALGEGARFAFCDKAPGKGGADDAAGFDEIMNQMKEWDKQG